MIMQSLRAFNTLKTELVNQQTYQTRAQATSAIFEYIEVFYNKIRRHSTIGYYSPNDYEQAFYKENYQLNKSLLGLSWLLHNLGQAPKPHCSIKRTRV
ncbi:MAG: IS3 family transposase [Candidatus Thiodubiliella endoseptemdiera]|uniref:IS3 family transposase n=1 Tax=Candidatus Thiodubiliella endoseptemdiera TaxID=2738886 RepID=A0A853F0T1_9GAMM|nr:IS3 family transposase [Candidatus Thiodubiliella endoseptemdiera]